jgi:hypothetical protein
MRGASLRILLVACASGVLGGASAWAVQPETPDACYGVRAVAIYEGFGWTHYVDVDNGCERRIACDVATSVDPLPTHGIVVAAGETRRVRVRVGSNTWEFEGRVFCHYT